MSDGSGYSGWGEAALVKNSGVYGSGIYGGDAGDNPGWLQRPAHVAVQSFPSPRLPDDHAGSIVFSVGGKEVLRIDPGSPPRVTVAEGVEASEGAMAVLCALASMIERYYPNWK